MPPPPTDVIKLAALRALFPEFAFSVTIVGGQRCYEAEHRCGGPVLSVTCTSAVELWRVLKNARERGTT